MTHLTPAAADAMGEAWSKAEPATLTEAQIDNFERAMLPGNGQRSEDRIKELCRLARLGLRASDPQWKLVPVELLETFRDYASDMSKGELISPTGETFHALGHEDIERIDTYLAAAPSPEPGR